MSTPDELRSLEFRVGMLERAFTSASSQLRELTAALANLARQSGSASDQPPPKPVSAEPDSVAPFSAGFYRREEDNTGRAFRWTGRNDHFEFRLGLNRNLPWSFAMELRPNGNVPAAKLRAFVDYVEVPVEVDAAGRFVRGTIPVREFGGIAILTFFLPKTFRPNDLDPNSKDARTLGLAFYGLKLEPAAAVEAEVINGAGLPPGASAASPQANV
jgi:hypothetical protein